MSKNLNSKNHESVTLLGKLFVYNDPGVYQIHCIANNKKYIGESTNVLNRLAKHSRALGKNESDCAELQADWLTYGPQNFVISVLVSGPEWENKDKRLQKESEIILSYEGNEVYNQHPNDKIEKEDNYRVICEINGKRYESIANASRKLNIHETKIRARLQNNEPGYVIIEKVRNGYRRISIDGREYESIVEAVEKKEANNRFTVMRRLKSPNFPGWKYLD